jgi:hypothetical protein
MRNISQESFFRNIFSDRFIEFIKNNFKLFLTDLGIYKNLKK